MADTKNQYSQGWAENSLDHAFQVPLDEIREDFFTSLNKGPVVVEAPTGCGKSTRLPLWCKQKGRVLVVEPRRLPCRSLAAYVASLEGTELGQGVGFAIRFEANCSEQSSIVFVTPGIALRWYRNDKFRNFDTVILDEFHERRWDTDLLASLLRASEKKVVITSATVEGDKLASFLNGNRLRAQSKLFPVQVQYSEKDSLPRVKNLEKKVADAASKSIAQIDKGDILVFLPGKGEIHNVKAYLEKKGVRAPIIPLHASAERRYQDRALNTSEESRIILATNVAETSLTLPGVRVVIDSGLERRTHYRNGRTVLALSAISQAAAEQRKGRAGRLGPGKCIRLWGKSARLESYTPPEVVREDPTEFILAAAACESKIENLECPDPPSKQALDKAKSRLRQMHALDENGEITAHGKNLFFLPLDSELAHLISAMPDMSTKAAMVDLAAALTVQGEILQSHQSEEGSRQLKEFSPEPCDATMLIRLLRFHPPDKVRINPNLLAEARRVSVQIKEALDMENLQSGQEFVREDLLYNIIKADPELVYVRRVKRRWTMGNGGEEVEIGAGTRFPDKRDAALVLDRHSIPGQRGTTKTLTIATCLAPVSFSEMSRADLGKVYWKSPVWDGSAVNVTKERWYAGRVIDSWSEEPTGKELSKSVAELVLEGKLWPGWGEKLQDDVAAWNLYLKLGYSTGQKIEAETWLAKRLENIGLESSEDLFLLEAKDLEFDGIPEAEREDFEARFPRNITLPNLGLEVEYEPMKKKITLVRRSGIRRSPPKRWELPAWGRSWSLQFRDGNRVVPLD